MSDDCAESQSSALIQNNRAMRCQTRIGVYEHNIYAYKEKQP